MSGALSARGREFAPVLVVWALTLVFWLTPGLSTPDGIGYFQYLPSDLNAYQPPSVLLDAIGATLRDPASWLLPLNGVPSGFKLTVLLAALAYFACVLGAGWALMRLPRHRREVIVTALATAWLLAASLILRRAASAGPQRLERHAAIIARNREPDAGGGPVQFRMGLLRQELAWLEAVGRTDDAARTRAELEALETKWGFAK